MFRRQHLRRLLPFWIAALIVGSFLPGEAKRALGTQSGLSAYGRPTLPHRAWHVASFGSTALLASLAVRSPGRRVAAFGAIFGLGVCIELLQPLLFRTDLEWWDVRDNGYGILAFAAVGQMRAVRLRLLKDESVI